MAYVGLADLYYAWPDTGPAPIPNSEAAPKARAAAEKALALDDTLAEPHVVLGGAYGSFFEWDRAEREFRRALELNPNEANAHHWYAFLLKQMGRSDEAMAEVKRAAELEPLNLKFSDSVGVMYRRSGQYDKAIEHFKKVLEMDPNYASAVEDLAFTYKEATNTIFGCRNGRSGPLSRTITKSWPSPKRPPVCMQSSGFPPRSRRSSN